MPKYLNILLALILFTGCSPKAAPDLEPLPQIEFSRSEITPFLTQDAWHTAQRDWNIVNDALRYEIQTPDALETRLSKDDRLIWKSALVHLEEAQLQRKDALILSKLQIVKPEACAPPSSGFSLQQRSQLQLALQLHRNILWRMGRLEMASRGVATHLQTMITMFNSDHLSGADTSIIAPIMQLAAQINDLRKGQPQPKGDWSPGALHYRMGRNAHAEADMLRALTSLKDWHQKMEASERWQYLANSAEPVIAALEMWIEEFETLIRAYRADAVHIQSLERDFAPPHALIAWPCINTNLRQLRVISELYSRILPMQWALSQAEDDARKTLKRLRSKDYAAINHEYHEAQVETFIQNIEAQKARLSRSEDLLLYAWDEVNDVIWHGLPDFIDPIHHHSHPAVEDAQAWNLMYQEIKAEIAETSKQAAPEPEQPLNKRGKPMPSFISEVLEMLHAPSRIDEAERSLLAISELEAHMVSIRDELMRLCKQGACRSFPEAELTNSPRTSPWIVTWRQSPASERTLGHTLIVIKLCQLHLSRLVQRLTEIYAWFSETSNADLSWKKLKSWQRIWTLYAEPGGTYASFLKSVSELSLSISDMAQPLKKRAESDELRTLLDIQHRFFDLTLDYARFIDGRNPPPTTFDELISTWELLDNKLSEIEKATKARDEALHPEDAPKTPARKRVDIPR
ncbi:MAG: hypothetical protein IJ165_14345 [Proteobacteria bacterium]|nr:hypothetical protein [Pseudomonadota bacterium]